MLASSVPYYEVRMDMKTPALTDEVFYSKIDSLAMCLSRLFGDRSEDTYRKQLINARREGNRYFLIKDRVDYVQLKNLKPFRFFAMGSIKAASS
jgi:cell division protein FtsI (penicillin-binding protein 3)